LNWEAGSINRCKVSRRQAVRSTPGSRGYPTLHGVVKPWTVFRQNQVLFIYVLHQGCSAKTILACWRCASIHCFSASSCNAR
jgi:hypothetical protein